MDLAVFRELLEPAGQRLLRAATEAYDRKNALALSTRLRRDHPAGLVAAALSQAELRGRAAVKFGPDARSMYFTRYGLEQATTAAVAEHRAGRIAASLARASPARVADLCCGIGGDLIGLARAGLGVTGVDRDPLTAEVARANLAALGLDAEAGAATGAAAGAAEVVTADAETYDRSGFAGVVADPARRDLRGRTFDPEAYSPPWPFVLDVLAGDACVKTAPGIPHALVPAAVEAEWVSDRGEVKEAALWSGRFRSDARRRATVLPTGVTLTDADDPGAAPAREPGGYLYEPDGAVIRAGLVTAVAPLVEGGMPHPRIAYLTSDRLVRTPLATAYRVLEVFPYDLRLLRRALRERSVGTLTVKKRGLDIDPELVRRRLLGKGDGSAILVCTRTETRSIALLVEPA